MTNGSSTAALTAANPNIFDTGSLASLKRQVKSNDPKALKAAAQQFEALFLNMVMKSMRDATPREGMFDNEQTRMYESLLDQQLAQVMGTRSSGTGLAAMIEKQLLRQSEEPVAFEGGLPLNAPTPALGFPTPRGIPLPQDTPRFMPLPVTPNAVSPAPTSAITPPASTSAASDNADITVAAREFGAKLWPAAVDASRSTGVPPHFMVAQAALETGWGKSELRYGDGSPTHNIFGIKAGRGWTGPVVEATTTEYVDGVPQKQTERFRAYGSYSEAFRDYANLLAGSQRYAGVIGTQDPVNFARGLQRAGYATDPMYAAKLERIIGGPTLRSALAG